MNILISDGHDTFIQKCEKLLTFKKIQLDSLAKRRIGIIHATDVLGCMRKTFLQKLMKNQNY